MSQLLSERLHVGACVMMDPPGHEGMFTMLSFSRPLEYLDIFTLLSSIHPYQQRTFKLLELLDEYVWTGLIITIVLVAGIHAMFERSAALGMEYLWQYSM